MSDNLIVFHPTLLKPDGELDVEIANCFDQLPKTVERAKILPYLNNAGGNNDATGHLAQVTVAWRMTNDRSQYDVLVVLSNRAKSEKFLESVARGKPVVKPDYFRACLRAKKWLSVTDFDIANPLVTSPDKKGELDSLHKRHQYAVNGGKLRNWKAMVLLNNAEKKVQYERILHSAGASVISWDSRGLERQLLESEDLTHIFTEPDFIKAYDTAKVWRPLENVKKINILTYFVISEILSRKLRDIESFKISDKHVQEGHIKHKELKEAKKLFSIPIDEQSQDSLELNLFSPCSNQGLKRSASIPLSAPTPSTTLTPVAKRMRLTVNHSPVLLRKNSSDLGQLDLSSLLSNSQGSQENTNKNNQSSSAKRSLSFNRSASSTTADQVHDASRLSVLRKFNLFGSGVLEKLVSLNLEYDSKNEDYVEGEDTTITAYDSAVTHQIGQMISTAKLNIESGDHPWLMLADHLERMKMKNKYFTGSVLQKILIPGILDQKSKWVRTEFGKVFVEILSSFQCPRRVGLVKFNKIAIKMFNRFEGIQNKTKGKREDEIDDQIREFEEQGREFLASLLEDDSDLSQIEAGTTIVLDLMARASALDLDFRFRNGIAVDDNEGNIPLLLKYLTPTSNLKRWTGPNEGLVKKLMDPIIKDFPTSETFRSLISSLSFVCSGIDLKRENDLLKISLANSVTKCFTEKEVPKRDILEIVMILEPKWLSAYVSMSILSKNPNSLKEMSLRNIIYSLREDEDPLIPDPKETSKQEKVEEKTEKPEEQKNQTTSVTPQKRIDPRRKNHLGETPLHTACKTGNADRVKIILASPNVNVNAVDNNGWTALHEACSKGRVECVKLLLKYNPVTLDRFFVKTPKKGDAKCNNNEDKEPNGGEGSRSASTSQNVVQGKTVDISIFGGTGEDEKCTAFHDAVQFNQLEIAKLLLEFNASDETKIKWMLETPTSIGQTPTQLAKSEEMKKLLISYGNRNRNEPSNKEQPKNCQKKKLFKLDLEEPSDLIFLMKFLSIYTHELQLPWIRLYLKQKQRGGEEENTLRDGFNAEEAMDVLYHDKKINVTGLRIEPPRFAADLRTSNEHSHFDEMKEQMLPEMIFHFLKICS